MQDIRSWIGILVLIIAVSFSGCVFILGGAVGAVGGYAITRDTIQGEAQASFERLWNASIKVAQDMGTLEVEDKKAGTLQAAVSTTQVKISIENLTPSVRRLRVTARRYLFPNLGLAQKIYIRIIEHAKA